MEPSGHSILAPYTPPSLDPGDEADEHYLQHRARRRFSMPGKSMMLFTAEQVAKLAKVNLKAAARLNDTLERGFDKVDQGQKRIHGALVNQTSIIEEGLDKVSLAIDLQTSQQAKDALAEREQTSELIEAVDGQTVAIEGSFKSLAAHPILSA